jgi:hypothetical protein
MTRPCPDCKDSRIPGHVATMALRERGRNYVTCSTCQGTGSIPPEHAGALWSANLLEECADAFGCSASSRSILRAHASRIRMEARREFAGVEVSP